MTPLVLTIGHSTHELDVFLQLLFTHQVTAIADVRSSPYSRLNSQFGREPLKYKLHKSGIAYVFLGKELGARPEDPECYKEGKVQYRLLAKTESFREGLQRLIEGAQKCRIALLCAERDPLKCHRALLIARELEALSIPVTHILADGSLETHRQAVLRLLDMWKMYGGELFRTNDELIDDAYRRQEHRVAYIEEERREEAIV
jgi:uncharacterized protein (DUF488 family)